MTERAERHDGSTGRSALLVVDMLNPYKHREADRLAERVTVALLGVQRLLERAGQLDMPVIYVNDNYGDWNSSSEELGEKAMQGAHPELVEPVLPTADSSFVVKARHNTFYGTPLEYLLDQMSIQRLIFTGQVTEQCILYSVIDAYVRHFDVVVATDAVAAIYDDLGEAALRMMERNLDADLVSAEDCSLG